MSAAAGLELVAQLIIAVSTRVTAMEAKITALEAKVAEHDKQLETPQPPGPPAGDT